MKKIATIIMITLTAILLSSCVINVTPESTHSFYFYNDTNMDIRDWYLLDKDGKIYSVHKDGYAEPVAAGRYSHISGLKSKLYQVYYEYENGTEHKTGWFDINSDATFKPYDNKCYTGIILN